eukprot:SAG31_NODE_10149_length_1178_cov_0.678406_1_plen_79_part_00
MSAVEINAGSHTQNLRIYRAFEPLPILIYVIGSGALLQSVLSHRTCWVQVLQACGTAVRAVLNLLLLTNTIDLAGTAV